MREKLRSEQYPGLGTNPLPTEPYISEEHFALGRERVFRRSWLQVGRVEEIPDTGDYFVRESVHAGIASRVRTHLILQDNELPIRHFHKLLCDYAGYGRCT